MGCGQPPMGCGETRIGSGHPLMKSGDHLRRVSRNKYAEEEELVLSQFPCWADLTPEQYQSGSQGWLEEVKSEA